MIRLVCICGKHLRARDAASLRHAVCPSCGCPAAGLPASSDESKPEQKPLSLKDGPLEGMGYLLVPLWKEGEAGAKAVPRYKVVTLEETTHLPKHGNSHKDDSHSTENKRKRNRRHGMRFDSGLESTFLFPFYAWRSIVCLAILLGFFLLGARIILSVPNPHFGLLKVVPALLFGLTGAAISCGFWMTILTATMRGEDSLVFWQLRGIYEMFVQFLRSLICFFAAPALILGIAWLYWLNCGDLQVADALILIELILAASMYWMLAAFAVASDDSSGSVLPAGIAGLFQKLGRRNSFILIAATLFMIVLFAGAVSYFMATFPGDIGSWSLFLAGLIGWQVFLSIISRWLGSVLPKRKTNLRISAAALQQGEKAE